MMRTGEQPVTWGAVPQGSLRNGCGDSRWGLQCCFVPGRAGCCDFLAVLCLGVPWGLRGLGCCTAALRMTGIGCCISICGGDRHRSCWLCCLAGIALQQQQYL